VTGEQQIAFVESQIRAIRRGATTVVKCPYCDASNGSEAETMCCPTFIKAVAAVLDRLDLEETQEMVERIQEGAEQQTRYVTLQ
jgi:uncharacterized protein YoaH (UPF0181 family)